MLNALAQHVHIIFLVKMNAQHLYRSLPIHPRPKAPSLQEKFMFQLPLHHPGVKGQEIN